MITLSNPSKRLDADIIISGSKSESNRGLILNKLFPEITLNNLSDSEDTIILKNALDSTQEIIDVHHAGTAMRFLTAYFAFCQEKIITLKGSDRMHQRPIYPLVEAIRAQGIQIDYLEKEGYPPLKIYGRKISPKCFNIDGNISSQYISALMLISSNFENKCNINLTSKLTSKPYLEMTSSMLEKIGTNVFFNQQGIDITPNINSKKNISLEIESDWSSASYWFSLVALSDKGKIKLSSFYENSIQGDSYIQNIYKTFFGVETSFHKNGLLLKKKNNFPKLKEIKLNLNATPDIAQTIAITCAALKIKANLTGLHTLKIKETDRLCALKNELNKIGVETRIDNDSIEIISFSEIKEKPIFKTYDDHRMAMSLAPLALIYPISIENPEVVKKSYPNFFNDLQKSGFILS